MHQATHLIDDLKQRRQDAEKNLSLAIEQIGAIKARRLELIDEKRRIEGMPVTKEDFIEFILSEIDKRGKSYPDLLLSHIYTIARSDKIRIAYIEDIDKSPALLSEPLLGWGDPYQVKQAALYYVFAEPIKAATRRILEERLDFGSGEKISRAYAAERMAEINAELDTINRTLDSLVESAEAFGYVDPDKFPVESEEDSIRRDNAARWGLDRVSN